MNPRPGYFPLHLRTQKKTLNTYAKPRVQFTHIHIKKYKYLLQNKIQLFLV